MRKSNCFLKSRISHWCRKLSNLLIRLLHQWDEHCTTINTWPVTLIVIHHLCSSWLFTEAPEAVNKSNRWTGPWDSTEWMSLKAELSVYNKQDEQVWGVNALHVDTNTNDIGHQAALCCKTWKDRTWQRHTCPVRKTRTSPGSWVTWICSTDTTHASR